MRGSFRTGLILVATGALLAGCDGAPEPDALFPLTPGLEWRYRVTTQPHGEEPRDSRLTMSNVERRYFAGEDDILIRRNQHGTRYYIAEREDGLYRVAVKSVAQTVPIMDQPPVRILPRPVETGRHWRAPAHTYLLGRARTFIADHAPGNTIDLDYHIEATDAEIDVPAGRYTNCVLAVGRASFHLDAETGFAASDVPIEQREWYCPGVGLARLSRDERLTSGDRTITGGRIEIVLTGAPG